MFGRLIPGGVVALAVVALAPVHVVAQDAPCDADPRWLLVTLLENRITYESGEHLDAALGQQVLDRCEIVSIKQENPISEPIRSTIMIRPHGDILLWEMTARESPQDICAAVRDCGDATLRRGSNALDR